MIAVDTIVSAKTDRGVFLGPVTKAEMVDGRPEYIIGKSFRATGDDDIIELSGNYLCLLVAGAIVNS